MKILSIVILTIFAFSACQTAPVKHSDAAVEAQKNAVSGEIKQVSVEQAKTALEENDAQFIDVRTPEEYAGGHAPKAVNFPLDQLETDLVKLERDKPVYLICETGRRSQKGSEILQKAGFREIYNIEGGTTAWTKANFPVEK